MNQHVHPTQDVPCYHFYFVCSFLIVSAFVHFVSICLFVGPKLYPNRIDGVMVSVLASSAVGCGFESRSNQTKDYRIGMCCFCTKHAALRSKNKYWLARNEDNVCEWSDMSTNRVLFPWTSTIKIQLSVLI
jgi:hypothetical protein